MRQLRPFEPATLLVTASLPPRATKVRRTGSKTRPAANLRRYPEFFAAAEMAPKGPIERQPASCPSMEGFRGSPMNKTLSGEFDAELDHWPARRYAHLHLPCLALSRRQDVVDEKWRRGAAMRANRRQAPRPAARQAERCVMIQLPVAPIHDRKARRAGSCQPL